jgi:hypothetical protein
MQCFDYEMVMNINHVIGMTKKQIILLYLNLCVNRPVFKETSVKLK